MNLAIPTDIPLLARWLSAAPKKRLGELKRLVTGSDRKKFHSLGPCFRAALIEAWDEEPDLFFETMDGWRRSRNPRIRSLVAGAVPLIDGPRFNEALDLLRQMARDSAREVRLVAVERLCGEIDAVAEEIQRFAVDKDPKIREFVAHHLREIRQVEDFKEVIELLCLDRNNDVHWAAAASLYALHDRAEAIVKECAHKMASSEDLDIRWAVVTSYYDFLFGENFERLTTMMRQWIRSGNRQLKWTLVHSLRYTNPSPRLIMLLKTLYADKDPIIRRRVIWQLGQKQGFHDDSEILALLEKALVDSSKKVREQSELSKKRLTESRSLLNLNAAGFAGDGDGESD
jgi:hypothetical protein